MVERAFSRRRALNCQLNPALRLNALSVSSADISPASGGDRASGAPIYRICPVSSFRQTRKTVSIQSKTEQTSINQFFNMVNFWNKCERGASAPLRLARARALRYARTP